MPRKPDEKEARPGAHSRARAARSACGIPSRGSSCPGTRNSRTYAGMALRGDRLAVVSQESSRLWVGRLRPADWTITGRGRVYDFPRTKKGKKLYGTVEGISWLSPRHLSPCRICARSGIRSAAPEPISQSTCSEFRHDDQSGNANEMIADPAATATCCLLSNTYVIGDAFQFWFA